MGGKVLAVLNALQTNLDKLANILKEEQGEADSIDKGSLRRFLEARCFRKDYIDMAARLDIDTEDELLDWEDTHLLEAILNSAPVEELLLVLVSYWDVDDEDESDDDDNDSDDDEHEEAEWGEDLVPIERPRYRPPRRRRRRTTTADLEELGKCDNEDDDEKIWGIEEDEEDDESDEDEFQRNSGAGDEEEIDEFEEDGETGATNQSDHFYDFREMHGRGSRLQFANCTVYLTWKQH